MNAAIKDPAKAIEFLNEQVLLLRAQQADLTESLVTLVEDRARLHSALVATRERICSDVCSSKRHATECVIAREALGLVPPWGEKSES